MKRIALLLAAVALPIAAQADVFALAPGSSATVHLATDSLGVCGQRNDGWRNAFFFPNNGAPMIQACWKRAAASKYLKPGAISICPVYRNRLATEACSYDLMDRFIDPDTLPKPAVFPK